LESSLSERREPVQTNGLNIPLNFAAKYLLGSRRYRLTDAAKCTMAANKLCQRTRWRRYPLCQDFLKEELEDAHRDGARPVVITVGADKSQIAIVKSLGYQPRSIMHYTDGNDVYFDRFRRDATYPPMKATARRLLPKHFERFCEVVGAAYCNWIWSSEFAREFCTDREGRVVPDCHKQAKNELCVEYAPDPHPDMLRLFMWCEQIREITGRWHLFNPGNSP